MRVLVELGLARLLGFGQIHQRHGYVFPFVAFRTVIVNPIALHLIFPNQVIPAVFQEQLESVREKEGGSKQEENDYSHPRPFSHSVRDEILMIRKLPAALTLK